MSIFCQLARSTIIILIFSRVSNPLAFILIWMVELLLELLEIESILPIRLTELLGRHHCGSLVIDRILTGLSFRVWSDCGTGSPGKSRRTLDIAVTGGGYAFSWVILWVFINCKMLRLINVIHLNGFISRHWYSMMVGPGSPTPVWYVSLCSVWSFVS
jgi:hypothetical protein